MQEITLIGTVHRELGLSNSSELYKILMHLKPEIIFEELDENEFLNVYQKATPPGLERTAIKKYRDGNNVKNIPVDLKKNELLTLKSRKEIIKVFNTFQTNEEYKNLFYLQSSQAAQFGFPYLNSDQHKKLMKRMKILESEIVSKLSIDEMSKAYKLWLDVNRMRESEMIRNIYTSNESFKNGLFLVGSEHILPIIDEIPQLEKFNKQKIRWNFNYFN